MKILFFLLTSFFLDVLIACEIHLPKKILVLNEIKNFKVFNMHQGCSKETLSEVMNTISSLEGKISNVQFEAILNQKNHPVKIVPNLLNIMQLTPILKEELPSPLNKFLQSTTVLDSEEFIKLSDDETIQLSCQDCVYQNNQTIMLSIMNLLGDKKIVKVRADFKQMTKAYSVQSFIPAFSEVSQNLLKEEFIELVPHTEFLTNLDELRFYKTNKPIKTGTPLRKADLTGIGLVKAGLKTEILIENQLLKIKTSGVARGHGSLGDLVEVYNIQKNQKYLGKVIDFNKVLVEL